MKTKEKQKSYAPRRGFRRYSSYVEVALFERFKLLAARQKLNQVDALRAAMKEWVEKHDAE